MAPKTHSKDPPIKDPFLVDYAPSGRAICKKCQSTIGLDTVRFGRKVRSPWHDGFDIQWHHLRCGLSYAEDVSEVTGWQALQWKDILRFSKKFGVEIDESHELVLEFCERGSMVSTVKGYLNDASLSVLKSVLDENSMFYNHKLTAPQASLRIADSLVFGVLPHCPICEQHSLVQEGPLVRCTGYVDGALKCEFKYQHFDLVYPDQPPDNSKTGVTEDMLVRTKTLQLPERLRQSSIFKKIKLPAKAPSIKLKAGEGKKTPSQAKLHSDDESVDSVPKRKELLGMTFASVGQTEPPKAELGTLIERHGGVFKNEVDEATTHMLIADDCPSYKSYKRCLTSLELGIPIFRVGFVHALITRKHVMPVKANSTKPSGLLLRQRKYSKYYKVAGPPAAYLKPVAMILKEESSVLSKGSTSGKQATGSDRHSDEVQDRAVLPPLEEGSAILKIDPLCSLSLKKNCAVYVSKHNEAYNCCTILTDMTQGTNKFYVVQLIERSSTTQSSNKVLEAVEDQLQHSSSSNDGEGEEEPSAVACNTGIKQERAVSSTADGEWVESKEKSGGVVHRSRRHIKTECKDETDTVQEMSDRQKENDSAKCNTHTKEEVGDNSASKVVAEHNVKRRRIATAESVKQELSDTAAVPPVQTTRKRRVTDSEAVFTQLASGGHRHKRRRAVAVKPVQPRYTLFKSWGRVGADNSIKNDSMTTNLSHDLSGALAEFHTKVFQLTGIAWTERRGMQAKPGRYRYVELETDAARTEQMSKPAANFRSSEELFLSTKTSSLTQELTSVLKMIFSRTEWETSLSTQNFDFSKMPLGSLSKRQLQEGYQILQDLQNIIQENNIGAQNNTLRWTTKIRGATNKFYSAIPHKFTLAQTPPMIDSLPKLRMKIDMIEQLLGVQIAQSIVTDALQQAQEEHPLDYLYRSLQCGLSLMDPSCSEYSLLQRSLRNTHAPTHNAFSMNIKWAFDCRRIGEVERFKADTGNLALLWHGSPLTNWASILSQGLRAAPPQAPVTGYMFDKGIYFADVASKAAQYCQTGTTTDAGLLMLCEVALGTPHYCLAAQSTAKKHCLANGKDHTWGVGKLAPTVGGAEVVWSAVKDANARLQCGTCVENTAVIENARAAEDSVNDPTLLYNEFVVYDESQVVLRYLLVVDFKFKSLLDENSTDDDSDDNI